MKRPLRTAGLAALAAALLVGAAGAQAPLPLTRLRAPAGQGVALELGGTLVAALAPGGGDLLVLVRPLDEPDGERRLLRLTLGTAPGATEVVSGLGGWIKTLVGIDLGAGPELVAGGLGRLASLGPLGAPGGAERTLLEHPGCDLRSLAPSALRTGIESRLAAAEAGWLRVWAPAASGLLGRVAERPLPVAAQRTAAGLALASPRAVAVAGGAGEERWVIGPLAVGDRRLRTLLATGDRGDAVEAWSALGAPEAVEQSWPVALDGAPALVVHTQGAGRIDLLEPQRLRVLPLAPDRTRAGAPPSFAVELDAKRWQATEVLVADADGDGHDDLVAAYPEGLTGGDLVVETWRGLGGGRFAPDRRRSDLDQTPASWRLLPAATAEGRPALVAAGERTIELYALAAGGRRALEPAPRFALPRAPAAGTPAAPAPARGAAARRRTQVEILGAAELDGRPGLEALVLEPAAGGGDRLVVLGLPAPGRAPAR